MLNPKKLYSLYKITHTEFWDQEEQRFKTTEEWIGYFPSIKTIEEALEHSDHPKGKYVIKEIYVVE